MNLPIDARRAPFKEKYLDEETPMLARWIQHGRDPRDGTYFVESSQADVFCGLSLDQANRIVRARERFVNQIISIVNDRP